MEIERCFYLLSEKWSNMFRKSRVVINGIELPEEFSGASIINNIAITEKRFAYVKNENIITGDIPEDGKLNVDGNIITIRKGTKGFNIDSMSAVRSIFNSGSISTGKQYEIDETYNNVSKVTLKDTSNELKLRLITENLVHIKGLTNIKPEFKNGNLFIDGLEGTLCLPKFLNIELNIRKSSGDIEGDIGHKGIIQTSSGDIDLELYSPLTLEVSTSSGDINVSKMISEGRGIYIPPNAKPVGTLILEASSGDINVRYIQD